MRAAVLALLPLLLPPTLQAGGAELRNWFDDPFFSISSDVPDCPRPAGPFLTEQERRVAAHHRAEKGTSCFLAGQCDKASFYAYDRAIAERVRARVQAERPLLRGTSLWVTVTGRVVYLEGCVERRAQADAFERIAREVGDVQQAVTAVRVRGERRIPYRRMDGR